MKHLFTFSLLFFAFSLFAQPANDDCPGIINLGPAPTCDSTLYNNLNATESNIGFDNFPACWASESYRIPAKPDDEGEASAPEDSEP